MLYVTVTAQTELQELDEAFKVEMEELKWRTERVAKEPWLDLSLFYLMSLVSKAEQRKDHVRP